MAPPPLATAPRPRFPLSLAVAAAATRRRPRVLCVHGFRSSADLLRVQLAPLLFGGGGGGGGQFGGDSSDGGANPALAFDWVFAEAPRPATGPGDAALGSLPSALPLYEWWGVAGAPYATAWRSGFGGFGASLRALADAGPYDGALGFSQGGGVASLVPARWVACFSAVTPPPDDEYGGGGGEGIGGGSRAARPSFHCFDAAEEFAHEASEVAGRFEGAEIVHHGEGHAVPKADEAKRAFRAFLGARLRELASAEEPEGGESSSSEQGDPME